MILSTRSASLVKRSFPGLRPGQILEQGDERLRVGLDQSQFGLRHATNMAYSVGRGVRLTLRPADSLSHPR